MKKLINILVPCLLGLAVVVAVVIAICFSGVQPEGPPESNQTVSIFDSQGNVLISTDNQADLYEKEYWAYLEVALLESAQVIAEKEDCSTEAALEKVFTEGYQIYTAFDAMAFDAVLKVETLWGSDCNTAAAMTDLKGNLLAVGSSDTEGKHTNHALQQYAPYSSFKALSVYTPAVEKGIVNWSTMYQDTPYKQIKNNDGELLEWPANASGTYSRENVSVYEALRTSLNTVAVKCLEDVGVANSVEFLQTQLGIPLTQEQQVIDKYGPEEVIGNVALGYLETGITPVEMAGYYQMFANGGLYAAPKAVRKIQTKEGENLYTRQITQKQVISAATADTMNKLLQGVVKPGGTGKDAQCYDVEVAGKTGTGDGYADNWFVGVTPGYSLAIWHGQDKSNQAAEMFSAVIEQLYNKLQNANGKFITHKNLYQIAYCVHSGKAFSQNCALIDIGYFTDKNALKMCDMCGK